MTELRYLPDADDVTSFQATVTEATQEYLVLDGTYFYPEGGGQPADRGQLSWDGGSATIRDVRKNHGDVRHYVEAIEGTVPDSGTCITGEIDAQRRERLRRMHTAQHVVSKVVLDMDQGVLSKRHHRRKSAFTRVDNLYHLQRTILGYVQLDYGQDGSDAVSTS